MNSEYQQQKQWFEEQRVNKTDKEKKRVILNVSVGLIKDMKALNFQTKRSIELFVEKAIKKQISATKKLRNFQRLSRSKRAIKWREEQT